MLWPISSQHQNTLRTTTGRSTPTNSCPAHARWMVPLVPTTLFHLPVSKFHRGAFQVVLIRLPSAPTTERASCPALCTNWRASTSCQAADASSAPILRSEARNKRRLYDFEAASLAPPVPMADVRSKSCTSSHLLSLGEARLYVRGAALGCLCTGFHGPVSPAEHNRSLIAVVLCSLE